MSIHVQERESCTHVCITIASGHGIKIQVSSCGQSPAAVVELKVSTCVISCVHLVQIASYVHDLSYRYYKNQILITADSILIQNKATSTDDLEMKTEDQEETQELFSQDQIQTPLLTPAHDDTANVESGSSTSLETDYEEDPDVPEGVIPQSQPCYRRSIHYTPLGLRRVY